MQLLPLVGFYWRRNKQISVLFNGGKTDYSPMILDALAANAPLIKKYVPALNADGFLDDAVNTLKEVFGPPQVEP